MTRAEALQTAKPILFNTEMVRAILDGKKTVTRRVIKPPAEVHECCDGLFVTRPRKYPDEYCRFEPYEPYKVSDILYIRETWCKYFRLEDDLITPIDGTEEYYYRADGENPTPFNTFLVQKNGYDEYSDSPKWDPSIHMPKEAARIFLRVTDVSVERLQVMRVADCIKEGVQLSFIEEADIVLQGERARGRFSDVWDSTIKKSNLDKYGWNANPWVWVIEFERIEVE